MQPHSGQTTSAAPIELRSLSDRALEQAVASYSRADLEAMFADDPWFANFVVNTWEYVTGQSVLTTYPWNVCIPIADICNASCSFCNSWLRGKRWLELNELDRLRPVLTHARLLGIAGHGEPLIHPQFDLLAERLASIVDPRCSTYLITNGSMLKRRAAALRRMGIATYNVSLNAATPQTHHQVMRLGRDAFTRIVAEVEDLVREREHGERSIQVNISLVVIRDNLHEVADFVKLGNSLNVDHIYVRTLVPAAELFPGLNYHLLPPYLHPDFEQLRTKAVQAIAESRVQVLGSPETWAVPTFSAAIQRRIETTPPAVISLRGARRDKTVREHYDAKPDRHAGCGRGRPAEAASVDDFSIEDNPYGRQARFDCRVVYQCLYVNDFYFHMNPCCYLPDVPAFEPMYFTDGLDFFELWNSPAMQELRRRLVDGPLLGPCRHCPPML